MIYSDDLILIVSCLDEYYNVLELLPYTCDLLKSSYWTFPSLIFDALRNEPSDISMPHLSFVLGNWVHASTRRIQLKSAARHGNVTFMNVCY